MTTPAPTSTPKPTRVPATPPPLLRRIGLLCLRPEQWAEAARFRMSATMWPVIVVALLMALVVGVSKAQNTLAVYNDFAAHYDERFFPMELKAGKLLAVTPATRPAGTLALAAPTFTLRVPRFPWPTTMRVVFDPLKNERLSVAEDETLVHVTDTEVVSIEAGRESMFGGVTSPNWESHYSLANRDGLDLVINGKTLQNATEKKAYLWLGVFVMTFLWQMLANLLWALLAALPAAVLVLWSASRLGMPRVVAYRIGLAVTVPLIVVGGILEASGVMSQTKLPPEALPMIWLTAALAMALWSGLVANRMYAPRKRAPGRGM